MVGGLRSYKACVKTCFFSTYSYKKFLSLILTPIAILFRLIGFRFSEPISQDRIGHLILEPLYMHLRSGEDKRFGRRFILFIPGGVTANGYALQKLPKKFVVIKNPLLCKLLSPLKLSPFCGLNIRKDIWKPNQAVDVFKYTNLISSSKPFFDLPIRESQNVRNLLKNLGISENDWYICLHNREAGYTKNIVEKGSTDFRNGSIDEFIPTINYVASLGGTVVRVGDSSMTPFAKMHGLVDYVHSKFKSEENDLLLSAHCRFFLTNSSGASMMAAAQGVPLVGVNIAPLGHSKFWGPNDIAVPKLYFRKNDDSPIKFSEIFASKSSNFYKTQMFEEANVYLKDTPFDEILEAVKQMLRQLRGDSSIPVSDMELQFKFNSLFDASNFSFYSQTKISDYFLRKHINLL